MKHTVSPNNLLMALVAWAVSLPAFAQTSGAANIGTMLQNITDTNLPLIYVAGIAIFAIGGVFLVGYGLYGLYARGDNPQEWKMGKCIAALCIGGGLLVVPFIAATMAGTASTGQTAVVPF